MKYDKLQRSVYPVINSVIRIFLLLITAGLCLQSMFSTSFIGQIVREDGSLQERTLNIADHPWEHLLVFLVFTVVGTLVCCVKKPEKWVFKSDASDSRVIWILSGIVLLIWTVWILITQLAPGSDPAKVFSIAMQWRKGDFSAYAEGGYLFRYPFQAGIILFYYFLSFLFGVDNYVGLQFVNVFALVAVYVLLVKLAALFWKKDRKIPVLVYTALILWVPLAFYVTYLYGILPGMALALGAVYSAVRYLDTRKYRYIVSACICMGLATVIKMNCLIYLVAIACFLLYDALDIALLTRKELGKQWIVSLAMIVLMGLSVAGCNQATERYVQHLSGYEAGDGEAMISWVVMGLQETPLGPGGYSGYIAEVFLRHEYDTEKIKENSLEDIRKIVTRMSENILDDGVTFFARKNAFQWNDPTFISLDRTKGRTSPVNVPVFASSLIDGRGSVALSVVLNYAQTLLLLGVLLYLLLNWRSKNLYELTGAVVFLGGYLFHFVWESSASYTIPYFVVMIPYAVKGLADWIRHTAQLPAFVRECKSSGTGVRDILRKNRAVISGGVVILILLALFSRKNLFRNTIALNDGDEARAQFYHEDLRDTEYKVIEYKDAGTLAKAEGMVGIRDGYYYISPYRNQETTLVEQEGKAVLMPVASKTAKDMEETVQEGQAVLPVSAVWDIEHKILLNTEKASGSGPAGISMRFRSNEQVLAAQVQGDEARLTVYRDDGMSLLYEPEEDIAYRWRFQPVEGEGYYILIDDMALTYRGGELTLEELDESEEQIWVLRQ